MSRSEKTGVSSKGDEILTAAYKKALTEIYHELCPAIEDPVGIIMRTIHQKAKIFLGTPQQEDLEQVGAAVVWDVLSKYTHKGLSEYTHEEIKNISGYVKGAVAHKISEEVNKMCSAVSMNKNVNIAAIRYMQNSGCTDEEIGEKQGMSAKFITGLLILAEGSVSLDAASPDSGDPLGNFIAVDNAIQEEFLFLETIKSHCQDAVDEIIVDLRCQWLTMAETSGRLHISRKRVYDRLQRLYDSYKHNDGLDNADDEWERFIMRLRAQKMTVQQMAKELNLPVAILLRNLSRFIFGESTKTLIAANAQKMLLSVINACHDERDLQTVRFYLTGDNLSEIGNKLGVGHKTIGNRINAIQNKVHGTEKSNEFRDTVLAPDIFRFCLTDAEIKTVELFQEFRNAAAVARQLEKGETTVRHRLETIAQRYRGERRVNHLSRISKRDKDACTEYREILFSADIWEYCYTDLDTQTLKVYFESDKNVSRTAKIMACKYDTVVNRLKTIACRRKLSNGS